MIGFYLDAQLKKIVSAETPKRFLFALEGGIHPGSLYLGDPYSSNLTTSAPIGAATLSLDQTYEFPASGSALIDGLTIYYTGKTALALTGVTGITKALSAQDTICPNIVWRARGNLVFSAAGPNVTNSVLVSLGVPATTGASNWLTSYGVVGAPFVSPFSSVAIGTANALRIDINVSLAGGGLSELTNLQVQADSLYAYQSGDVSVIPTSAVGTVPSAPLYVLRRDQGLPQTARLLPASRQILDTTPGFTVGDYRWRDQDQINASALVPTRWDADVQTIGVEKFVTGIGANDDLKPLGLVEVNDSVHLQIQDGSYFDGPNRWYLSGSRGLEFKSATALVHNLADTPRWPAPVYVGNWLRDSKGFYSAGSVYRYQIGPFTSEGLQFQLDRTTNTITLNQTLPNQTLLVGVHGNSTQDIFNLPVYPIGKILSVYVYHGVGTLNSPCTNFVYDSDQGILTVNSPPALQGEPIYVTCEAGIALLYETADAETLQLPVDLNPAFSGITNGYIYLQHRRLAPISVSLACDKPTIAIPATYASVIGLIAYGPVHFGGDYALLSATAYGPVADEVVPNCRMKVIIDPTTWSGLLNYQDPLVQSVYVTTGADGVVNIVFTPSPDWGFYIPPIAAAGGLAGLRQTTIANDTIVLPQPVPISQVWDGHNWLIDLYTCANNDPIYGMVGADASKGQVVWATSGTPGSSAYKTNGSRQDSGMVPIKALDINGKNFDQTGFTGNVVALVFAASIPTTATIGSYFITFLQDLTVQLQVEGTSITSNTIMLQMATPPPIQENPWLILNSATQGQLNIFRLGI